MCSMTDPFRKLEREAGAWHDRYIESFDIIMTNYEIEHFVNKWHENLPWDACPIKTAQDCTEDILKFRSKNGK